MPPLPVRCYVALSDNQLGRGMAHILDKTIRREPPKGYLEVEIGLIVPSKANPRKDFDQEKLEELAANLKQHGVLQPLVVIRRADVGYELVSGERRLRAARIAGLLKVPVVIRDETDPQHLAELRLIENIQRQDLGPGELAQSYQTRLESHGLTHDDLATRLNISRSGISNTLRVLSLPVPTLELVRNGSLSLGHAKALLSATDAGWQQVLGERAASEGLSVRETERLAKLGPQIAVSPALHADDKSAYLRELEANLRRMFNTRVSIKEKAKGRGTVTFHFLDHDQYNRIIAIMDKFVRKAGEF